jgi:hypothetical protein
MSSGGIADSTTKSDSLSTVLEVNEFRTLLVSIATGILLGLAPALRYE